MLLQRPIQLCFPLQTHGSHKKRILGYFGISFRSRSRALHADQMSIADRRHRPIIATYHRGWRNGRRADLTMISIDSESRSSLTRLFALTVKDLRLFRRVTDFLKDSCLSSIGSSYDENAEAAPLLSGF